MRNGSAPNDFAREESVLYLENVLGGMASGYP